MLAATSLVTPSGRRVAAHAAPRITDAERRVEQRAQSERRRRE
jgi:hypothetical protein